jgi:basic membrane protein A
MKGRGREIQRGRWGLVALAAAALTLAAGCGGDDEGAEPGEQTTPAAEQITVALVTDIGGLNDRSFNELAFKGLQQAESELGVEGRVLESKSDADYIPNLSSLAEDPEVELIIGVGFLIAEALNDVAVEFPDKNFAIIDVPIEVLADKPANVRGLIFSEQEGGYLAGYTAALVQDAGMPRLKPELVVSSVGGQKIPPVDRYIAGFQAGAKAANPDVETLNAYSQDFVDQAKCKEIALDQIAQGSDAVIQLAGGCGLGALDAADEEGIWGIGADADQSFLGDHILVSALKKVDVSVFETIKSVQDGTFQGGQNTLFDVKSGGVGIGGFNPAIPEDIVAKVREIERQIAAGEITDIPTEVAGG